MHAIENIGLGSGIQDPEKPYSGSWAKKAPDPGSTTLLRSRHHPSVET
jgi:hypothetical protein